MLSGGARWILVAGVVVGATIAGWIIGAGIDFVTGNQGWWGVGGLGALMAGAMVASRLVEGRQQ